MLQEKLPASAFPLRRHFYRANAPKKQLYVDLRLSMFKVFRLGFASNKYDTIGWLD